jgi:hypothetical protein
VDTTWNPKERGEGATTALIIREIQEVQGGQEAPHYGGVVLHKDVHVTPFSPKGLANPILSDRVPSGPIGINGLPSGHADFDIGHLGLL